MKVLAGPHVSLLWLADHDVNLRNGPLWHQDLLIRRGRYKVVFTNAEKGELRGGFGGRCAQYYRRTSDQMSFDPGQKSTISFEFLLQENTLVRGGSDVDRTDPSQG